MNVNWWVESAMGMEGNPIRVYGCVYIVPGHCRGMLRECMGEGATCQGNAGECRGIPKEHMGVGVNCQGMQRIQRNAREMQGNTGECQGYVWE